MAILVHDDYPDRERSEERGTGNERDMIEASKARMQQSGQGRQESGGQTAGRRADEGTEVGCDRQVWRYSDCRHRRQPHAERYT